MTLRRMDRFDTAQAVMIPLIALAKRFHQGSELMYLYMSIGGMYLFEGRYDECLKLYNDVLNLPEIESRPGVKTTILFNTGLLYYKVNDIERALEYDFNTLVKLRHTGDPKNEVPQLLINISLCYISKKNFKEGERYIEEALAECGDNCTDFLKMQSLFGYGMLFFEQDRLDKAEEFFLKSYPMAVAQDDSRLQLDHLELLADIYITQKRFTEARRLLKKSDSILSVSRLNSEAEKSYFQSIRLYKATGDVHNLAVYQEKYLHIRDSVYSKKLRVNLTRAEGDFQKRIAEAGIKSREEIIDVKNSLINWQRVVLVLSLLTLISVTLLLTISVKRSRSRRYANYLLEEKVKERTASYSSTLSEVTMKLKSQLEMTNKLQSDINNAMTAIGVLCSLGIDDPENRAIYFQDINKLSLKVMQHMEGVVTNSST